MPSHELPPEVRAVLDKYRVCEFSTQAKDGTPIVHAVCAHQRADGTFRITTSIGLPNKAFNIRRNPKVSMLFSEPMGSGLSGAPIVLVQGDATAPEDVVSSLEGEQDYWLHRIFRRQPDSAMMSAWLMRPMTWWYFLRILITVTPRRIRYWPGGDMSVSPVEITMGGA